MTTHYYSKNADSVKAVGTGNGTWEKSRDADGNTVYTLAAGSVDGTAQVNWKDGVPPQMHTALKPGSKIVVGKEWVEVEEIQA